MGPVQRSVRLLAVVLMLASGCVARVSVASDGSESNGSSLGASVSANGRFMAFVSYGSNLVPGDTNARPDIFVRDVFTGTTSRVSVSSTGEEANHESWQPSISDDGRYIAFRSLASNLVSGDTAGYDAFVHDRLTSTTIRASVTPEGGQADGSSYGTSISADGSTLVFESEASNLVADDTNDRRDVFARDLLNGTTTRVSVSSTDEQGDNGSYEATVSADGSIVAFASHATNLVAGDINAQNDIFVHDRSTAMTTMVSVSSDGDQTFEVNGSDDASISASGRYVAFATRGHELVPGDLNWNDDVFVHDRDSATTTLVSIEADGTQGNGFSASPTMSADGSHIAFVSGANFDTDTNGRADVFILDRDSGAIELVSVANAGHQVNGASGGPAISANGVFVAFSTGADNLLADGPYTDTPDTNDQADVYLWIDTD